MNRSYTWVGLLAAVPLFGSILGQGCPPPPGGSDPPEFVAADTARGGALYDKYWAVKGLTEPTDDHPLWASRPDTTSNTRTGADTWRCKECHGWDYKGVDGAYGTGSHRTGVPGIFNAGLSPQAAFDLLKDSAATTTHGHDYGAAGLSDADIWDLVKFVLEGQIDTDDIVDGGGAFIGDAGNGQTLYNSGIGTNTACAVCHGTDGLIPPPGHPEFEDWVGAIANENPWEFQHKVRFGQPGTAMPQAAAVGATDQEVGDLGAYSQTLPEAP